MHYTPRRTLVMRIITRALLSAYPLPLSVSELSAATGICDDTCYRALSRLEGYGWVTCLDSRRPRRYVLVSTALRDVREFEC